MECPLTGLPCEKTRPHHITEIDGDKIVCLNLCEDCVASYLQKLKKESVVYNLLKSLANLFHKIIDKNPKIETIAPEEKAPEEVKDTPKTVKCPHCGASFQDLAMTMNAGCAKCYEVFELPILQVINTVQKSTKHTGKVPKTHPPSYKSKIQPGEFLAGKKIKLQKAIMVEDYESAAKLRDQIEAFNQLLKDFRKATKDKDREESSITYRRILAFIGENS